MYAYAAYVYYIVDGSSGVCSFLYLHVRGTEKGPGLKLQQSDCSVSHPMCAPTVNKHTEQTGCCDLIEGSVIHGNLCNSGY